LASQHWSYPNPSAQHSLLPMTIGCMPGGWQPFAPETQPSPASRPESPVLNQHFCSPSSVPHTHHWHSGKDMHTLAHDSISLATNLSELMQSSRKQPIVAPKPWRFVNKACPALRITVFCCWQPGQSCAITHIGKKTQHAANLCTNMAATKRTKNGFLIQWSTSLSFFLSFFLSSSFFLPASARVGSSLIFSSCMRATIRTTSSSLLH